MFALTTWPARRAASHLVRCARLSPIAGRYAIPPASKACKRCHLLDACVGDVVEGLHPRPSHDNSAKTSAAIGYLMFPIGASLRYVRLKAKLVDFSRNSRWALPCAGPRTRAR